MADTLKAALLDGARRPAVIADLGALVDSEVSAKSGVSGAVTKTGYAGVKKFKPGFLAHAIGSLLPGFVDALEPLWAEHRAGGGGDFGAFLATHSDRAADALVGVTDARAKASDKESLRKMYDRLRPNAKKNVREALPRLGRVIDKHAAG
ncbi:MAG: DUF6918 family protein [Sporichthyaceae bacterium]